MLPAGSLLGQAQHDVDYFEQKAKAFSFKKGITMGGSLGLNTINYYASQQQQGRRDPFNWFANGSLNINLFGLDVPFTFSYSNARMSYTQPFNRFKFVPRYKWINIIAGTSNMTFSNYTLAGHQFNGYGIELTPKKWKLQAMKGVLKEAIPYTDIRNPQNNTNASFKRVGYGAKLGYDHNGQSAELIFFKAKDDVSSIPIIPPGALNTPMENIVLGFTGKKRIGKKISVDIEYAISGLTTDLRGDTAKRSASPSYSLLARYLKQTNTTRYFDAVNAGFGYTGRNYALQLRYERIAPEYQTLGAYYFNSDMENITIAPMLRLFKGKLNLTGNIGVQRNNLDKLKASTTRRFVGNLNTNLILNDQWTVTAAYSNFSTYTNMRPKTDPFFQNNLDTLNFYQVNQNFNANLGYNFGNKIWRQGLMFMASYQRANDQSAGSGPGTLSDFYSGNLSYSLSNTKKGSSLSASLNYNLNKMPGNKAVFFGPNVNLSNKFLNNRITSAAGFTYNKSLANGITSNDVISGRWSLALIPPQKKKEVKNGNTAAGKADAAEAKTPGASKDTIAKKKKLSFDPRHSVSLNFNYTQRLKNSIQKTGLREMTITANYMFNF